MKKLLVVLLATVMVFSCVACGNNGGAGNTENTENTENNAQQNVEVTDATDLLTKVWDEYNTIASEDVKFPIGGGDAANMVMDAPGAYDVTTEGGFDGLVFTYCIPETVVENADDFATVLHMMNANNFASVGLHFADTANVETAISEIKDTVVNNQWMCGMPEKLIIVTVNDEYVISAYGLEMLVDVYEEAIMNVYGDAAVVVIEEDLM